MKYDADGVIHVSVMDIMDLVDLGEMKIKRTANLTENTIQDKEDRMSNLKIN